MDKLFNKDILFFYPYGATKHYGDSIRDELLRCGANVFCYDERPSQNSIVKIAIRLFKNKLPGLFLAYIRRIIKENRNIDFDYILICRAEAFSEESINLLSDTFKNAIKILYLWDILKTNNKRDIINLFDKSFSFDPLDSDSEDNLRFRPTFFMPEYGELEKSNNIDLDIVFIGTLHGNRYERLSFIKNKLIGFRTLFYFYVPSILVFFKDKLIRNKYASFKEVFFKPLDLTETLKIIERSKSVLDINYPGQSSLSMRAYESMASRTKYITNNKEIMKYDFYNPNNIFVLDELSLEIPLSFLNAPFEDIPTDILSYYSVKGFVEDIFKI